MAAGHLYLVLAVLFLVGSVLGLDVDLRELKLQEHGGNIQTQSVDIEPRNVRCRDLGGFCVNVNRDCPSNKNTSILPPGRPYCNTISKRCCHKPVENTFGVEDTSQGCPFGHLTHSNGSYLMIACMELLCNDGTWEYEGRYNTNCGKCSFGGEPYVYPFDTLTNKAYYSYNKDGEYSMTQDGFGFSPEYGVNANFTNVDNKCWYLTCVSAATYHEHGTTVEFKLPGSVWDLNTLVVHVNGSPYTIVGNTVTAIGSLLNGVILVFRHPHIESQKNANCISVIGTRGLTMSFCERTITTDGYPWAYIFAMPMLRNPPGTLYGLCNHWTGQNQLCFTDRNTTCVNDWSIDGTFIRDDLAESWKTT